MKAVLCKEYGLPDKLVMEDVPSPEPGEGEIRIDVRAAAVNFPDLLIIQNKYQIQPPLPFSPGSEVAGIVSGLGKNVTGFKPGDRVFIAFGYGGFAEQVLAPADKVTHMPDDMDFDLAASLLITYGTSHYALKDRGRLKPGETLLVLGAAGGVGLAAVEIGKAMGARVIAAASSEEKLKICKDFGADETILYPSGALDRDQQRAFSDRIKALTGGKGADVVYDPVGGDYSEPALRATNWEGRFLVIGFAAGTIPKVPLNLALLKGCDIVGVLLGAYRERDPEGHAKNIRELTDWVREGRLKPHISVRYPLSRYADALNDIATRKAIGKIVLVP